MHMRTQSYLKADATCYKGSNVMLSHYDYETGRFMTRKLDGGLFLGQYGQASSTVAA